MDNKAIRQSMIQKRLDLTPSQRQQKNEALAAAVFHYINPYQTIGLYCSYNGEVDTYGLMESWFWDTDRILAVPSIVNDALIFHPVRGFDDLREGVKGILASTQSAVLSKGDLDVILVPLVAFNEQKYRIGYGKGYYDRYLSDYPGIKVGLAYDFQCTNALELHSQDIAMDVIITDADVLL